MFQDVSLYAPCFIVTQSPISSTFGDFWTMIKEQQVELIFCLLNDNEVSFNLIFRFVIYSFNCDFSDRWRYLLAQGERRKSEFFKYGDNSSEYYSENPLDRKTVIC